jgi:hypothetical protein
VDFFASGGDAMVEISPRNPVHVEGAAFSISDDGLMTQAAFLLAAGAWFRKMDGEPPILPNEDLDPLGLADWHLVDGDPSELFDPLNSELRNLVDDLDYPDPDKFHAALGPLIYQAYRSRRSLDLAKAVLKGTGSPDALIRICALTSAFEMFKYGFAERVRKLTQFDFSENETSSTLAAMLLTRTFRFAVSANNRPPAPQGAQQANPGLMLIHGTNFPPSRPVWSVPGTGPLFQHIAGFRKDIYAQGDYYRWEGGYSAYAREVAAYNLDDWVQRRNLAGIDAVAHSHGCNVVMAATQRGIDFNKVVFLSCPVRWQEYQPRAGSIAKSQSIRVRLDLVILADRSGQRFPKNTIPEKILPIWFVSHSATTEPATWNNESLQQYI